MFAILSAVMLASALLAYHYAASFVRGAARAQGTLIALVPHLSNGVYNTNAPIASQTPQYRYQPTVQFQRGAQPIQFRDSFSSRPPRYHVGDTVSVLYRGVGSLRRQDRLAFVPVVSTHVLRWAGCTLSGALRLDNFWFQHQRGGPPG